MALVADFVIESQYVFTVISASMIGVMLDAITVEPSGKIHLRNYWLNQVGNNNSLSPLCKWKEEQK